MDPGPKTQERLEVVSFTLGPAATNAYLVGDSSTGVAAVIDPAWDGKVLHAAAADHGWRIANIWLTHAHFDHFGGAAALNDASDTPIPVALHPADQALWRFHGGAAYFGVEHFDPGPEPTIDLEHGMRLRLGAFVLEVRYTPGHTPGHVAFLDASGGRLFCGDLVFKGSVGRTDLPGGDWDRLRVSLRDEVLTLPDEMRLFPGHGPVTIVGDERRTNPFLADI